MYILFKNFPNTVSLVFLWTTNVCQLDRRKCTLLSQIFFEIVGWCLIWKLSHLWLWYPDFFALWLMDPPLLQVRVYLCLWVLVHLSTHLTPCRMPQAILITVWQVILFPPKKFCIFFRIVYQWLQISGKVCRIFEVSKSIDVWVSEMNE